MQTNVFSDQMFDEDGICKDCKQAELLNNLGDPDAWKFHCLDKNCGCGCYQSSEIINRFIEEDSRQYYGSHQNSEIINRFINKDDPTP